MSATVETPAVVGLPPRAKVSRASADSAATGVASILVPVDFSDTSMKVMEAARTFATRYGGQITLLHVLEVIPVAEFASYPAVPILPRTDEVKAKLTRLAEQHGCGPEIFRGVEVRTGVPFREITTAAEQMKADLIVIATHGYTGLTHVLLGSTAERVVRHATCPVLVVPVKKQDSVGKKV